MNVEFFENDNEMYMLCLSVCHWVKASVDGDSAYALAECLQVLIQMIGRKAQFELPMLRSHLRVMKKSRFSVQCKHLAHNPVYYRGKKCHKVGLHRYPNIELGHFRMEAVPNVRGTIYLVMTNVPYLRNTSNLYREEQALVNAVMNETIHRLNNDLNNEHYAMLQGQFSRMNQFYSRVRGEFGQYLTSSNSHVSGTAMLYYTRMFDQVMHEICSSEDDDFKYEFVNDPDRNGMYYDIDEVEPLKRQHVLRAVETFSKGLTYTFSLPGFKHVFKDMPQFTRDFVVNPNPDIELDLMRKLEFNVQLNAWINAKANEIKNFIKYELFSFPRVPEYTFKNQYYIDIGFELTPLDPNVNLVCQKNGILNMFREISNNISNGAREQNEEVQGGEDDFGGERNVRNRRVRNTNPEKESYHECACQRQT